MKRLPYLVILCLFFIPFGLADVGTQNDNVVFWQTLDNSKVSGTTFIDSADNLNFTAVNGPTSATGVVAQGRDFIDGSTQYATSSAGMDTEPAKTIVFWYNSDINLDGGGTRHVLLQVNTTNAGEGTIMTNNHFGTVNNEKIHISLDGTKCTAYTGATIGLGAFNHYAFAWNDSSNSYDIYINGTEVATEDCSGGASGLLHLVSPQMARRTLGQYADGILDEIAIYNVTLDGTDINDLYTKNLAGSTYPFAISTITNFSISHLHDTTNTNLSWVDNINVTVPSCATYTNVSQGQTYNLCGQHNRTITLDYPGHFSSTFIGINQTNHNVSGLYNTKLTFLGDKTGTNYSNTIYCEINNTGIGINTNGKYTITNNTHTLACEAGASYPAFNTTLIKQFGKTNTTTFTVSEYTLELYFDTNTTGNVVWSHPTEKGQNTSLTPPDYNYSTFAYVKIKGTWADESLITVQFNPQVTTNETVQIYQYINDRDVNTVDYLKVLSQMDVAVWPRIYNYADEELLDAMITVEHCPTHRTSDCRVVDQRISQPQSGTAVPGNLIWLDSDLDYHITISKSGYETETVVWRGVDYETNGELTVKLKPTIFTHTFNYKINGPHYHNNESTLSFTVSKDTATNYYYATTYQTTPVLTTLTNGGDLLVLSLGTHYLGGTNWTLSLYTYNSTSGVYTTEATHFVEYQPYENRNILGNVASNSTLFAILWALLIIISSMTGVFLTRDGMDTGYTMFGIGAIILAFINSFFIPVAAIIVIGGAANLLFGVTRE